MKNAILVTGGSGAIGSNLVNHLAGLNRPIVVLDNLSSGRREHINTSKRIIFIKGDITKDSDLKKAFSCGVSFVIHLAAHFANQNSIDHPEDDLSTNVLGTLKLLEYSVRHRIGKFIYASTSCVYGDRKTALQENTLDFKHDTPYSISKLAGEKYVTLFGNYYGLATCILRYFNVYGPGELPGAYRNVIPNFFHKAMKGEPLIITGTGQETRDFTYVDDITATTIKALEIERSNGMIFNVASGVETRIIDVARKINRITKNNSGIVFSKRRDWDNILRRRADIKKAKNILGHKVSVSLDEGLEKTYRWLKAHVKL